MRTIVRGDLVENPNQNFISSSKENKKTLQWELWQSCNNNCAFCYLGKGKACTSKERKLKSLIDLRETLDKLDYNVYNKVSLIGGEFFQGQMSDKDVNDAYFSVIDKLCELYSSGLIDSVWILASLMIGDQKDLYKTLRLFADAGFSEENTNNESAVWVCTSWDDLGRFHNEKQKQNWKFHIKNIKKEFPWVKLNTAMILTQGFCEKYLDGSFSPSDFAREYDTVLCFAQTRIFDMEYEEDELREKVSRLQDGADVDQFLTKLKGDREASLGFRFYPDRKTFRKFLVKLAKQDPDFYDALFNLDRGADEIYKNFNNKDEAEILRKDDKTYLAAPSVYDRRTNPNCRIAAYECKHPIAYAGYIDCNDCMLCDKNQIESSLNNE
jgi:hypothetical protein